MKIDNIGGMSNSIAASQVSQVTDTTTKNLQIQIANAKQQLQNLSKNEEMSMEEKEKKRQEIQKQIAELNNQLRQHQIELRKEKKQNNGTSTEELFENDKQEKEEKDSQNMISSKSMEAMISADTAMGHAKRQGSLVSKMEGRARVLQTEIDLDNGRGGAVEGKQGELSDIEQDIANVKASQFSTLGAAHKKIKEAVKQESEHKTDNDDQKKTDDTKAIFGSDNTTTAVRKNNENDVNRFSETILGSRRAQGDFSSVDIHF